MSSVIDRKATLAWYEEVCQKLDALKDESARYADEEDKKHAQALGYLAFENEVLEQAESNRLGAIKQA